MRIERTGGMVDGEPVYHVAAYAEWWEMKPLATVRCHPKQPGRWLDGKASKRERAEVRAALAKLKEQEPEDDGK